MSDEQINGTDLDKTVSAQKFEAGTHVSTADRSGRVVSVRGDGSSYLVRHDDDGKLGTYEAADLSLVVRPKVRAQRVMIYTVELPFPQPPRNGMPGDQGFASGIPQPALYQRAHTKPMLNAQGGVAGIVLVLTFLGSPDAERVERKIAVSHTGESVNLPVDGNEAAPELLDTVMSPYTGQPIGLWMIGGHGASHDFAVPIVEVDAPQDITLAVEQPT